MGRANRDDRDDRDCRDDDMEAATDEGTTEPPVLAARAYTRRGWAVIPLAPGTKRPIEDHWPHVRLTEATVTSAFSGHHSHTHVGMLGGAASGGLVDVDCDVPEATAALLPATGLVHGRPGKPTSHSWYVVDDRTPGPISHPGMPQAWMPIHCLAPAPTWFSPASPHANLRQIAACLADRFRLPSRPPLPLDPPFRVTRDSLTDC